MKRSVIILVILCSPLQVFAWHSNTHLQMTRDAVMFMPEDFQKFFKANRKIMAPGVRDPDEVIGDFENHYYLADTREGGAIDRIDSIISTLQTKLSSGKDREAVRQFCYLAHYIGDLWTPESLIKKDQRSNLEFVWHTSIVVLFEGYQYPVENYQMYFQQRSAYRWTLENSESISSLLYSEAVNDIAQTWLSIWHRTGKSIQPLDPLMIEHNKERVPFVYDELPPEDVQRAKLHALIQKQREESGEVKKPEPKPEPVGKYVVKALLTPGPEVSVLENSLKSVGNQSFFVARLRLKGAKPVKNFSVSCRGQDKKLIQVDDFNPGEVVKIEAILPAEITKEDLQYRYFEK